MFGLMVGAAGGVVLTAQHPQSASAAEKVTALAGDVRVTDGDTIRLAGTRIRLWGMDAPERDQTCEDSAGALYRCGDEATHELASLVSGERVTCEPRDTDQYGRTVARCSAHGEDIAKHMVRTGHALDYTRYSHGAYLPDELRARRDKAGVWQGDFTRPEDWRRRRH
jgi:endonuclease YncB( thermonuclease family)